MTLRSFYENSWAQGQLAYDYSMKAQKTYTVCQSDLGEIAVNAKNQARLLIENYYNELNAAAMGDDAMERASAAWTGFQREYDNLNEEYLTSVQKRYEVFLDTMQDLQSNCQKGCLDGYIGLLQNIRNELATSFDKAEDKPKKSDPGRKKTDSSAK